MNDMMLSPLTMSMSGADILFEQKKFEHKFYGFLIVWSISQLQFHVHDFAFIDQLQLQPIQYSIHSNMYSKASGTEHHELKTEGIIP